MTRILTTIVDAHLAGVTRNVGGGSRGWCRFAMPWTRSARPLPCVRRTTMNVATPFRFEVTLVKVKGSWLVDDFTPVTGAEQ